MLFYIIHALVFTLLINHLSMIVHIDNPVLKWLGSHIFSIYILQRIPMIIGDHLEFIDEHMIVYFIFSLVMTGIMAEVFDRFCSYDIEKGIWSNQNDGKRGLICLYYER